jgi:hypothetical protein
MSSESPVFLHRVPMGVTGISSPVLDVLGNIWPPLLAALLTIALLCMVRAAWLLRCSRSPRVQISSFGWAGSEGAHQEATWVTSLFREQLAALRLDALDPLPERAPGAQLVEIVEGVGQSASRDIGAAAGRLYKAMLRVSGYVVWGSLRPRTGGGGGRISVQLIERRHGNRTLLNVALEATSWENGAREAALAVAGALYPRVRKQDRGPWAPWKKTVPREVVRAYHEARRYESEHRLEYALESYETALKRDPLNPNLRLKIAMLKERLELDLDAWVTYEAIVDESNPRAWRGPNRRVYLLALYRIAVILTNGRIAEQWVEDSKLTPALGCTRDRDMKERREQMRMSLNRDALFDDHKSWVPKRPVKGTKRALPREVSFHSARSLAKALFQIDLEARPATEVGASPKKRLLAPFDTPETGNCEADRGSRIKAVLQILSMRRLE